MHACISFNSQHAPAGSIPASLLSGERISLPAISISQQLVIISLEAESPGKAGKKLGEPTVILTHNAAAESCWHQLGR